MGKEKEKDKKDKDKKDKDKKDKDKKDKDKKDKDKKDKDKKDKDKKDKDKKDKDKKDKDMPDQEWKLDVSKKLDDVILAYQKIVNKFKDMDNYILKGAKSMEEFKEKVLKEISELPEIYQNIYIQFLDAL